MVTEVSHCNALDHVLITVPGDHSTEDVTSCTCTRRLGEEEWGQLLVAQLTG